MMTRQTEQLNRAHLSLCLIALAACGSSGYSLSDGGAPEDQDPTDGFFQAPEPTEGGECPSPETVCSYGPGGVEREVWACGGAARYDFTYIDDEEEVHDVIDEKYDFYVPSPHFPPVYACCDDALNPDYCGGVPPPQAQACFKDCAYQVCRKFVYDYKKYVDANVNDPDSGFTAAYHEFLMYIDTHTSECQTAILSQTGCEDVKLPIECEAQAGVVRLGRWEIPNDAAWVDYFENYVFQGECEVVDWAVHEPAIECEGAQKNNDDPFPPPPKPEEDNSTYDSVDSFDTQSFLQDTLDTLDGGGDAVDPFAYFEATSVVGTLSGLVGTSIVSEGFSLASIFFKYQTSCVSTSLSPCSFAVEKMSVDVPSIDLGDVRLVNVEGTLLITANGHYVGATATLPPQSVQIAVVGTVESEEYPLLDNLPFSWIVYNESSLSFDVDSPTGVSPTITIVSGTFSTDLKFDDGLPQSFEISTLEEEYLER